MQSLIQILQANRISEDVVPLRLLCVIQVPLQVTSTGLVLGSLSRQAQVPHAQSPVTGTSPACKGSLRTLPVAPWRASAHPQLTSQPS